MGASGLVVVLARSHEDLWVEAEVELGQLGVLVESDSVVLKSEVCVEASGDVGLEILT